MRTIAAPDAGRDRRRHERAMGVRAALGPRRGAGGERDQRQVVGPRARRVGAERRVHHRRPRRDRGVVHGPGRRREPVRGVRLEIRQPFAVSEENHVVDKRAHDRLQLRPELLRNDRHARAAVLRRMLELLAQVHRVDRHGDGVRALDAVVRGGELGRTLAREQHAVAGANPGVPLQPTRHGLRIAPDRGEGDVVTVDTVGRLVRIPTGGDLQIAHQRGLGQIQSGGQAFGPEGGSRRCSAHGWIRTLEWGLSAAPRALARGRNRSECYPPSIKGSTFIVDVAFLKS
ncbi:hypothetical protein D9M68_466530 [compost metagenome]